MNPYEHYKDSGIDWIGAIPAHWEVSSLKRLANVTLGKMLCPEDKGGYSLKPYLKSKNIGRGKVIVESVEEMWFSDAEMKEYLLQQDDLLLSEGGEVGKTAMWEKELEECYIQNSVHRVRAKAAIQPKFLFYFLTAVEASGYYKTLVNQVSIAHLTKEKLIAVPAINPPLAEQAAIAEYLDRQTAEIDATLARKEAMLQKLQDLRAARIHEVVTRGLHPNSPLKDSGVEWIGEIPEGWEVRKLKQLLANQKNALKTGPFGSQIKGDDFLEDGPYKVYTQRNVLDNDFEVGTQFISDEKFRELRDFEVYEGDFLFTTRGSIGKTALVPMLKQRGVLHPCLIKLHPNRSLITDGWLLHFVNGSPLFMEQVKRESNSTIIDVIYSGTLKEISIPLPPLSEQTAIAEYLDAFTQKIDALRGQLKTQMETLRQYRQSLITEVVTGKWRVAVEEAVAL